MTDFIFFIILEKQGRYAPLYSSPCRGLVVGLRPMVTVGLGPLINEYGIFIKLIVGLRPMFRGLLPMFWGLRPMFWGLQPMFWGLHA